MESIKEQFRVTLTEHHSNQLPSTGFMRLPAVLAVIPVSKSTWWAGIKTGRYPKPVKLGQRITAWKAEDIKAFIDGGSHE
jgi:prophage regulatory protein